MKIHAKQVAERRLHNWIRFALKCLHFFERQFIKLRKAGNARRCDIADFTVWHEPEDDHYGYLMKSWIVARLPGRH